MTALPSLRRLLAAAVLAASALSTAACNTVAGIGQDIRAAGDAIAGTAEDTKEEIKE